MFLNFYSFKNLVKQNSCLKNPDKPICFDLILTNYPRSFQNTDISETKLSDFHKITFIVLKQHFKNKNLKLLLIDNIKIKDYFRIELEKYVAKILL